MKIGIILSALLVMFSISSCAAINNFGYQVNRVLKQQPRETETTSSGSEIKILRQQYAGSDLLKIDSWTVFPDRPVSGDKVTSRIQLVAFKADPDASVELTISRSLIMGKETIQFGKPKIEQLAEGEITLSWNFTLPVDADAGEYVLVTKVDNGKLSEQVKNRFLVQ